MSPRGLVWFQPVRQMINQFGLAGGVSEHDRKVALRHWSTAAQYLREALEKVVMVAHDEAQLSSESVDQYMTSCTYDQLCCCILLICLFQEHKHFKVHARVTA